MMVLRLAFALVLLPGPVSSVPLRYDRSLDLESFASGGDSAIEVSASPYVIRGNRGRVPAQMRFSGPLYGPTGQPVADDVHQGTAGDCYFMAGLMLLAQFAPLNVINAIREVHLPSGERHFTVLMHDPSGLTVDITVNDKFYVGTDGSPVYAKTGDGTAAGCVWPMVLEKAWAVLCSTWKASRPAGTVALIASDEKVGRRGSVATLRQPVLFAVVAPSYLKVESDEYDSGSGFDLDPAMWELRVGSIGGAIALWGASTQAQDAAGKKQEPLGARTVAHLWAHAHQARKPATIGTAHGGTHPRLQYPHEYAVVGSALLTGGQVAYAAIGSTEGPAVAQQLATHLDAETLANTAVQGGHASQIGGEKYLIVRNPVNDQQAFTDAMAAQHARGTCLPPAEGLNTLEALHEVNVRVDGIAINVFLVKLSWLGDRAYFFSDCTLLDR